MKTIKEHLLFGIYCLFSCKYQILSTRGKQEITRSMHSILKKHIFFSVFLDGGGGGGGGLVIRLSDVNASL